MRDELRMDEADAIDLRDAFAPGAPRRARWRAAAAAVTSLAALLAVVVWSYRLQARDPSEVPVIRAAEGPAKIRPEDPGGERFDHQGRAVYDAIVGEAPPEREVALAPEPERLLREDAPIPALRREADLPAEAAAPAASEAETETVEIAPRAEGAEPLVLDPGETPPPFAAAMVEPTARAPVVSLPAPSRAAARFGGTEAAAIPEAPEPEPAAPSAGAGGPRIQLGAYLTAEDARSMWETIRGRNRDLLAGRQLALETLDRGGRTLHLLRVAPFADSAEARALCVALKARGEDCLVPGA